jgi:flavin-dependent dehydrogenase
MDYDVLVAGSGIGGMESALKLGDMGYKVLVVEKEPSIGGKMIHLSELHRHAEDGRHRPPPERHGRHPGERHPHRDAG